MNVDSADSAYIAPALPMASCTMVEIDPKQNHGGTAKPHSLVGVSAGEKCYVLLIGSFPK